MKSKMESLKEIKSEDLGLIFDSEIIGRGEEYFEEGLVSEVELVDDKTLVGTVIGNNKYIVTISIDKDGEISCDCSCPCDFNCKHAVALLLNWINLNNKKAIGKKSNKLKDNEPSLQEILSGKKPQELIELVIEFIKREPRLKSLIMIKKDEIFFKIKNLLSSFWEWNEVQNLISELNIILEGIKKSKSMWDKGLFNEIEKTAVLLIKGQDSVHDEGEFSNFIGDWFELYGEIFASLNPSIKEKEEFVNKIKNFVNKDEYGFESDMEKALYGMCKSKEDILIIKDNYKISREYLEEGDLDDFFLSLYEKVGTETDYLNFAKEKGFSIEYIDKLVAIGRLNDAIEECYKQKEYSEEIEDRKIKILMQIGKTSKAKRVLFELCKETCELNRILMLKKQCSVKEWKDYREKIIEKAKKKKVNEIVSRIYYHDGDYLNAYEYAKNLANSGYLELLSKKLSDNNPNKACFLLTKLIFQWINSGSGYPYKKSGNLLREIKEIDKSGKVFKRIKKEIIAKHKKKYSLMEIIKKI